LQPIFPAVAALALGIATVFFRFMVRLQKFLADAGVASRRAAERMILDGRITVNGATVTELGSKVKSSGDEVAVDGNPVRVKRKLYLAINKPAGYVCTKDDPEKRRIVTDLLPEDKRHVQTVGRLDRASEGLLLLTNDGDFSLHLAHPRYGVVKTYVAIVTGKVGRDLPSKLVKGISDRGEFLRAQSAKIISANNTHSVFEVDLTEGKNREVRRMLAAFGFQVERLIRVRIGKLNLADLPLGKWRTLTETEIKSLLSA
jgi:23S rRNA pseudouridine2605 synthase